jgi:hypothetical protein
LFPLGLHLHHPHFHLFSPAFSTNLVTDLLLQLQASLQHASDQIQRLEQQSEQEKQHLLAEQLQHKSRITNLEAALSAADAVSRQHQTAASSAASSHNLTQLQLQECLRRESAHRHTIASQVLPSHIIIFDFDVPLCRKP